MRSLRIISMMEEGSSPKIADQSLGSDGASPFTNTSTTSEDSGCGELSPDKLWTPQAPAGDEGGESSLGVKHPITRLMERTGYSVVQLNGQRRYGPPPDWEGEAPSQGCEVFVCKIPRDCFEDELVPVFEKMGKIYELRLKMPMETGLNGGCAFVVYGEVASAKESVRQLNYYEIRKGRKLGVSMGVDNCRLYIGRIPKYVTKEDIKQEVQRVTEAVVDVVVYPSEADKTKNRGFAFVEYDSHGAAAMARRKLMNGQVFLWGNQLAVDWAEPELKVDEEIMAQVKALHIRNLMLGTTEDTIEQVFSVHAPVEKVKKIRHYAYVHFHSKEDAHEAMEQLNGSLLDGAEIEVTLARPSRPKFNRVATLPTVGFNPLDSYGTMIPAIYPSSYPISPVTVRNSMGMRMMLSGNREFLPIQMVEPNQRQVIFAKQSEEPLPGAGYGEMPALPPPPGFHGPTAALTQGVVLPKPPKNPVQFLEEVCLKNNWLYPVYTHIACTGDIRLYSYKVTMTSIAVSYLPRKLSRSTEEAKSSAAEYTLSQLGYIAGQPLPQTDSHAPPSAAFSVHVSPPKPL